MLKCKNECSENGKIFFQNWIGGELFLPNGKRLGRKVCDVDASLLEAIKFSNVEREAYISLDGPGPIDVKNFDPSIRYARFGHGKAKKLGEICSKISGGPVLFANGDPCCVPGIPIANIFRVKDDAKHALLLTYL